MDIHQPKPWRGSLSLRSLIFAVLGIAPLTPDFPIWSLVLWTTGMSLMLLTLAFIRLGSPTSTTEVTVAASFLFLLPVYINSLTGGYASSRFKQLRHKGCWTFIYASVFVAIVAFMRDWPLWVSGVSSGLGIAASLVLFSIARFSSQGGRNIS